jgi:hypothetical protein
MKNNTKPYPVDKYLVPNSTLVYIKFYVINSKTSPFLYWRKTMIIRRISRVTAGEIEKILEKEVTAIPDKTEGESILNGTAKLKISGGTDQDLELLAEKGILVKEVWSWELPWRQIPGHMKAYTWMQTLAVALTAFVLTGRTGSSIVGAILFSLGEFHGNQATHLTQPNHRHDMKSLTLLERVLLTYPTHFRRLGLAIMVIGLVIAFRPH